MGFYGDNGKSNGNYYSILGFYANTRQTETASVLEGNEQNISTAEASVVQGAGLSLQVVPGAVVQGLQEQQQLTLVLIISKPKGVDVATRTEQTRTEQQGCGPVASASPYAKACWLKNLKW